MPVPTVPGLIREALGWYAGRSITGKVRRVIMGHVFHGFRRAGLALPTGLEVLRWSRELNVGIGLTDLYALRREVNQMISQIERQQRTPSSRRIDPEDVPIGRWTRGSKYQYRLRVHRVDQLMQQDTESDVWFHSSHLMSEDTVLRKFMEQYGVVYRKRYDVPHAVELVEVWQRQ